MMETRAKAGFVTEAREAFEEFARRQIETGRVVQEETRDLYDLLGPEANTPLTIQERRRHGAPPEPQLFGRKAERNRIRAKLRTPPSRNLRVALISGEAGIGKTRLVREALSSPVVDGQKVLLAESAELEQLIPLNPLIEMFREDWCGGVLRALDEPWRTVLFGVMPKHYLGGGPIPEAPHIQPGSVPRRLFEAFYQLLLGLVNGGPLILVLEDLQWADETTLTVLEFLIRRWDRGDLQMLVSVRGEEVWKNPGLTRFLEKLQSHEDFLEIPLKELEKEDSEALIQQVAPRPLGARSLSRLRSLAGGNPYFLIELTLELLANRLEPIDTPRGIVPIPISIRQVLDRRLSQLSPEAERALSSLSVYSRPIERSGVAQISQLSESECVAGLEQLEVFRLVTVKSGKARVSHELVRHTVYQSLTESRRSWIHDQVGRYILRTRKPAPPDELAVHFDHAGSSAEAVAYASEAANRAEASGAVPEALRFLRIAREHSDDPEKVANLIGRMGHLNHKHQNLEEAAPLLEIASQRYRRQGETEKALEAELARIDCLAQTGGLPPSECLAELKRIKAEAMAEPVWGVFARALDVEAHHLDHRGNSAGVVRVLTEAHRYRDKGDFKAASRARTVLALNVFYGSPRDGLSAAREAVKIAFKTTDTDLQLHALNRLIVVLLYQGRLHTREGKKVFSLAQARVKRSGDLILRFFIKLNRAVWHLEIGELDKAAVAFQEAAPVIEGKTATNLHTFFFLNEGELGLSTHNLCNAEESYQRAARLLRPSSPEAFHTIINAGLGLCALRSGNLAEARRREEHLPDFPDRWRFDPSTVVFFKASMLRRRGDHPTADRLLAEVAEDVKTRLVTAWIKLTLERARRMPKPQSSLKKAILNEILRVTKK
ncbi:MAG: AAA family ATPase, partial [Gemmatimonadota bacterium]